MGAVSRQIVIHAPAEKVWATLRDFGAPGRFLSIIASVRVTGSGMGMIRTVTTRDGGEFQEELKSLDDAARTLTYSLIRSPRPIANHLAAFHVRPVDADRCEVEWSCSFQAVNASEAELEGIYGRVFESGLQDLKRHQEDV